MIKVDKNGKLHLVCHHCSQEFHYPHFDSANPFETLPKGWLGLYFPERGIELYCGKKSCSNVAHAYLGLPINV